MKFELSCIRNDADQEQITRCKDNLESNYANIKSMSKVLSIVGNEVRLKILFLLYIEGELCPCDLADILEMSVPAISQHLRKIKDAGIINYRREGQTLYYTLVDKEINILTIIFETIGKAKKIA